MVNPTKSAELLARVEKQSVLDCTLIETSDFLNANGITVVESHLTKSAVEAADVARRIGLPVAMKLISARIPHKSDLGGVILNLQSEDAVKNSFAQLMAIGERMGSQFAIEGVAVQRQVAPGREVIVGGINDSRFGPVVMLGSGGVSVEFMRDVIFRPAPVVNVEAEEMIRSLRSYRILQGIRGTKSADLESLGRLLVRVSQLMTEEPILELDLNPVILYEQGYAIVDAKMRLQHRMPIGRARLSEDELNQLSRAFNPRGVAVIGASGEPGKVGYSALRNLIDGGFAGKIYPVNLRSKEVLGLRCYESVKDIRQPVDLAIIAIPAQAVPSLMEELGQASVAAAIVLSSGFAEVGNGSLQNELVEKARHAGVRVIGPNTYGVYVPMNDLCAVFTAPFNLKGPVALASQSGGVGMAMLGYSRSNNLGASAIVGLGNKCDIDEDDLIEYFGRDSRTTVIALHMEDVKDGRSILDAARRTSKTKPILVLKAGKTPEGMTAASSHTGSMASDYAMIDQMLKSAGIVTAESLQDFFDKIKGLAMIPNPVQKEGVLVVTGAGGLGVLICDACSRLGLQLMKPPVDLLERLKSFVPPFGSLGNPIDITGSQPPDVYRQVLSSVLLDNRVSAVVLGYWQTIIAPPKEFAKAVIQCVSGSPKKPIVVSLSGDVEVEDAARLLEQNGIPAVCYAPERAVTMLAAKLEWWDRSRRAE